MYSTPLLHRDGLCEWQDAQQAPDGVAASIGSRGTSGFGAWGLGSRGFRGLGFRVWGLEKGR